MENNEDIIDFALVNDDVPLLKKYINEQNVATWKSSIDHSVLWHCCLTSDHDNTSCLEYILSISTIELAIQITAHTFDAVQRGHINRLKVLLNACNSINLLDDRDHTLLSLACEKKRLDVVRVILDYNPDIGPGNWLAVSYETTDEMCRLASSRFYRLKNTLCILRVRKTRWLNHNVMDLVAQHIWSFRFEELK